MYIEAVPNRNSPPAILLRESYRDGGRVKKRTLLNLSDWPPTLVAGMRAVLKGGFDTYLRYGGQLSYLDPMVVLPVMARATRHLGLGATLSTTLHHPYHLARTLASLDHLSDGRPAGTS